METEYGIYLGGNHLIIVHTRTYPMVWIPHDDIQVRLDVKEYASYFYSS